MIGRGAPGRYTCAVVVLLVLVAAGCSDDEEPDAASTTTGRVTTTVATTTTAPERPASTTTTALDPATVEGQVEAAYLRSWDVYADAVYNLELDEEILAEVYAGESLQTRLDDVRARIADGRAAHVLVDHDYEISIIDEDTAQVLDRYRNHQVLIDPETKEPLEPDPDEEIVFNVQLTLLDGTWKVTFVQRMDF